MNRHRWPRSVALAVGMACLAVPAKGTAEEAALRLVPASHEEAALRLVPASHEEAALRLVPTLHEIPADVIVRAFVKAEDGVLRLVVRVPLASMRDVDFPVRGPGYVEIDEASALLDEQAALWIAGYVALYEESSRLPAPVVTATRISLPSDPSFADYDRALAHMSAPPLPSGIDLVLEQAMLDVVMSSPIESARSRFSIDPAWAHLGLRTTTVLRFITPDGAERVFQYAGNPGRVGLDPRWHQAFLRFVALGFAHILDGIDHLLFLLCLVIPLRRFRPSAGRGRSTPGTRATMQRGGFGYGSLVSVVTAFTAAHSITLGASVLGLAPNTLWFPPLIETLIAASIVFMAVENIVARTLRRRWMWAFGFGLVHGFGFSFQLRESLQFAGPHLFTSLLGFNAGVELGQLFALLFMIPGLGLLFGKAIPARTGGIVISALVAHTSWHWMAERWGVLTAYDFQRPAFDAAFGAAVLRWAALLLIVAGAAWALAAAYRRLERRVHRDGPVRGETGGGKPVGSVD